MLSKELRAAKVQRLHDPLLGANRGHKLLGNTRSSVMLLSKENGLQSCADSYKMQRFYSSTW